MTKKTLLLAALAATLAACGEEKTASGPICVGGECTADLYVACFATDEVKGVKADLSAVSATFPAADGPIAFDFADGGLWVAHSGEASTLVRLAPGVAQQRTTLSAGNDLQEVRVAGGLVHTTNSSVSTLVVVDPARGPIDEVSLKPASGAAVFPQGLELDAAGARAYVALYGSAFSPSFAAGQAVAVVDLSGSRACAVPPCASVVKTISLDLPGAYDAGGFPFPSRVLRVGSRYYVTLSNLKKATPESTFYGAPAGSGRLAVVDSGANDAVTIVDLGGACTNPGGLAADGDTVYVSCASGVVVPVRGTGAGAAISIPTFVPGQIAMCKGAGYVTDQFSGRVARFTPAGVVTAAFEACPAGEFFTWAADVECGP